MNVQCHQEWTGGRVETLPTGARHHTVQFFLFLNFLLSRLFFFFFFFFFFRRNGWADLTDYSVRQQGKKKQVKSIQYSTNTVVIRRETRWAALLCFAVFNKWFNWQQQQQNLLVTLWWLVRPFYCVWWCARRPSVRLIIHWLHRLRLLQFATNRLTLGPNRPLTPPAAAAAAVPF